MFSSVMVIVTAAITKCCPANLLHLLPYCEWKALQDLHLPHWGPQGHGGQAALEAPTDERWKKRDFNEDITIKLT